MPRDEPKVWYVFTPRDNLPEQVTQITTAVIRYLRFEKVDPKSYYAISLSESFWFGLGDPLCRGQLADLDRIIRQCSGCRYAIEMVRC